MSRVPIIVMTADRPPELQGVGANQTIDQQKLFGGFVKWFCDTGVPEDAPGASGTTGGPSGQRSDPRTPCDSSRPGRCI